MWLSHLAQTGRIALSPQAINEAVSVLLKRQLPFDEIASLVAPYFHFLTYPIDQAVIRRAIQIFTRHQTSWWDALMIGWAAQAGCELLLTEDTQSAPVIGGVKIFSPFDFAPDAMV